MNQKILWMSIVLLSVGPTLLGCRSSYNPPMGIVAQPRYVLRDMAEPKPDDGGAAPSATGEGIEQEKTVGISNKPEPQGKQRPQPTYGGPPPT